MGFDISSQKQHINLTDECWRCIFSDLYQFSPSSPMSMSGILNRIIENFWKEAEASVDRRVSELREVNTVMLTELRYPKNEIETFIKIYTNVERSRLVAKATRKAKGIGRKFNLSQTSLDILSEVCTEDRTYESSGKYLHTLFEEYASLSAAARERIIFRKLIDELEEAIYCNKLLSVKTDGKSYQVLPYKVVEDSATGYNYLITVDPQGNSASFRISRIAAINGDFGRRRLTDEQKQRIEEEIALKHPAYMLGDLSEIEVLFTREGVRLYSTLINNRPTYYDMREEGENTRCFFRCTERQAMVYFSRFGSDAVVCNPKSLSKKLGLYYQKATQAYSSSLE